MATLKKYSLDGSETGEVQISDEQLASKKVKQQLIKDYIVAIQANKRQWSANTKGRSEISHSGAKPHPQKGTGRARQGTLAAPQYKGGGIVFGPKPKFDQHVKINKKERRAAICHLLSNMIAEGRVHVLESVSMEQPKTKVVKGFLNKLNIDNSRVLFLGESNYQESIGEYHTFTKSMRNLERKQFKSFCNINGYDLAIGQNIVIIGSALNELIDMLGVSE